MTLKDGAGVHQEVQPTLAQRRQRQEDQRTLTFEDFKLAHHRGPVGHPNVQRQPIAREVLF
jgi:hypothetical protein